MPVFARIFRAAILTIAFLCILRPGPLLQAQGQPAKAGGGELISLDFAGAPLGAPPKDLRVMSGKLEVVEKDDVHMLRSSEDSTFLLMVPEKIPNRFALEFELVPKFSGRTNTTELSFEGTREVSHSVDSAHVMWSHNKVSVIGGGQTYAGGQIDLPEDLKEEIIGNLTTIRAEFNDSNLTVQTNGRTVFESTTAKFNRGRVLRVQLGGTDDNENAVYLASMRMVALDGGSGTTAQMQSGLGDAGGRSGGSQPERGGPPLSEVNGTSTDPDTSSPAEAQSITGLVVTVDARGVATVTWNPLSIAATYQVMRWNAGDPSCCNNMSPPGMPLQNAVWQDGVLPVPGTYAYRVIATTADGLIAGETQIAYRGAATSPAGIAATTIPTAGVPTIAPEPVTTTSSTYMTPGRIAALTPPPGDTTGDSGAIKFDAPAPSDLPTLEESVPADSTAAIPTVSVPTIAPEPVTTASSTYMTPGRLAALAPAPDTSTGDSGVSTFSPPLSSDLPTLEESVPPSGDTTSGGTAPTGTVVTAEPAPYSSGPRTVSDAGGATGGASGTEAPFVVTVTPGITAPVVTWTAAPNATGYIVSRSKVDDLNCCNTTSGRTFTATSPWQDQPLPVSGTYLYKVFASTPTGTIVAETQFGFRMPGDNSAVGTPTVTAVLVDPTTTGTITPISTNPTPNPATTGTVITEPAPTVTSRDAPAVLSNGPAPTNLTAGGIPGLLTVAQLNWDAVAGATHYKINRALAGTTEWTSLVTEPYPTEATFAAGVPDPTKTYTYEVIAYQADGRFGAATIDWHTPAYEPTNFTATPIAPGQVRLEWDNLPLRFDAIFGEANSGNFFLSGPGTGTGLAVVASSTSAAERNSYTLTGVPAGSQTWTLTVDWTRWGIITPSTSWTKATATVAAVVAEPAPRYRLVALGFRALQQSKDIDDARDGHGDEIYFSAMVNRTRLTGEPLPVTSGANLSMVMTRSHGDEAVSVPYGRIKSGTASATGGIKSGDAVPTNLDPAAPTGPLQTLTFPIVVWEGELGDNDVVVVHPVLWEDDVNPVVQALWAKAIVDAATSGYVIYPEPYESVYGPGAIRHDTADQIYEMNAASHEATTGIYDIANGLESDLRGRRSGNEICTCTVVAFNLTRRPCEAHGVDRPIGLEAHNTNMSVAYLERLIFLSRASVAAALSGTQYMPYMGWPRGTFSLKLRDQVAPEPLDIEAIASYDLFFRIEQVR